MQTAAPSLRGEVTPINMRDASEIERAVEAFVHTPNGRLIVRLGSATTLIAI